MFWCGKATNHPQWGLKFRTENSKTFNRNGRKLQRYIDFKPDTSAIGPLEYSFYPGFCLSDVLDIAVRTGNWCPMEIYTVQERSSYHNPIILQVGCNEENDEDNQQEERTQTNNWDNFRKNLDSNLRPIWMIEGTSTREVTKTGISKFGNLPHEIKAQMTEMKKIIIIAQRTGIEELPIWWRKCLVIILTRDARAIYSSLILSSPVFRTSKRSLQPRSDLFLHCTAKGG